ncbi:hypothetical protein [Mitsuokella jalaludinii]|uniref:hypothetical protein n=2 Tax=Mitsuokella jalaludinii TaxID=187979 RepID=UPI00206B07B4|nr:MAG TPA: hypothetical protein [Myoviridae sp. ctbeQ1]
MIEVKVNMTESEIDEAQRKNQERRRAALSDFKAGKKTSGDTCKILKSCDNLHIMLERMRKKARR